MFGENEAEKIFSRTPQHNDFIVKTRDANTGQLYTAKVTSNFDSGNMAELIVPDNKPNHYIFYPAADCDKSEKFARNCSWFYFQITGLPQGIKVTFEARKLNILHRVFKTNCDVYRPVIKIGEKGTWKKIKERPIQDLTDNKELYAMFPINIDFDNNKIPLEIAFCFPYKHSEMLEDIQSMQEILKNDKKIYFHKEILIKSYEGLDIPLLTITSHDCKTDSPETYEVLEGTSKCPKFELKKPVILLSSRVHPGETPASHAQNGVIKFQLNKENEMASVLLKSFVFKIVPTQNPDGVYNGHFRKDRLLQNLNRFYKRPDIKKQSSCYALRNLMDCFSENHRLIFFMDFHAHSGIRNNFVYGNHSNFVRQVETRLFAQILDKVSDSFTYEDSDFSAYQMKHKEKTEETGKEGTARVMGYIHCLLAHSYTMELTYHSVIDPITKEEIKPQELIDFEALGGKFCEALIYQFNLQRYLRKKTDIVKMDLSSFRSEIANSIKKLFTHDENRLENKANNINNFVEDQYYLKIFKEQMLFLRQPIKEVHNIFTVNETKKSKTPKSLVENNSLITKVDKFAQRKNSNNNKEKPQPDLENSTTINGIHQKTLTNLAFPQNDTNQFLKDFTIVADLNEIEELTKCQNNVNKSVAQVTEIQKSNQNVTNTIANSTQFNNSSAFGNKNVNFRDRDLREKAQVFNSKDKSLKEKFCKGRVNFKLNSYDINGVAQFIDTYETNRNYYPPHHRSNPSTITTEHDELDNKLNYINKTKMLQEYYKAKIYNAGTNGNDGPQINSKIFGLKIQIDRTDLQTILRKQ